MLDEQALINGSAKGDRKAQQALYESFAKRMYVICLRYSKSDLEAEDILQESFIKVFKSIANFRGESSLYYWIKRIVVNTALNYQRSKLYMYPMVDVDNLNDQVEKETILSGMQMQDLLALIQQLPTGCQVIFNLYAVEGYQHKEIAEMLKITEGTSKSQYARARQLLREKLENLEPVVYERYRS